MSLSVIEADHIPVVNFHYTITFWTTLPRSMLSLNVTLDLACPLSMSISRWVAAVKQTELMFLPLR